MYGTYFTFHSYKHTKKFDYNAMMLEWSADEIISGMYFFTRELEAMCPAIKVD